VCGVRCAVCGHCSGAAEAWFPCKRNRAERRPVRAGSEPEKVVAAAYWIRAASEYEDGGASGGLDLERRVGSGQQDERKSFF
jgi:hypothetical protein